MEELDFSWIGNSQLTKGQATKLRIILAALELFSEKGFANVTLQMIADDSDTSHPLILKHFGHKNNILLGVRKYITYSNHHWVDAKVKDTQDAKEKIYQHCLGNLKWAFENRSEAKIILLTYYHYSLSDSEDGAGVRALSLGTQRIQNYVAQAEREGFAIHKDVEFTAQVIHEYLVGIYTRMLTSLPKKQKNFPAIYAKKLQFFLDMILDSKQ